MQEMHCVNVCTAFVAQKAGLYISWCTQLAPLPSLVGIDLAVNACTSLNDKAEDE